jgi:hypothetical protein
MFKIRKELWAVVIALTAVVVCFTPDASAESDRLVAHVAEAYEVNGKVFPAGELSLKAIRDVSPVATLNEIRVNGQSVGMLLAQQVKGEATEHYDGLVFRRAAEGHLVLEAVAFEGEPLRMLLGYSADCGPKAQWCEQPVENRDVLMAATR